METKKKKTLTKNYGSFQLEGLMVKAKEKRIELDANAVQAAEKATAAASRDKKKKEDLLQFQLCERKCICEDDTCKWEHHKLCSEDTCGALIYPMETCFSAICKALKQQRRKDDIEAKTAKDEKDMKDFHICRNNIALYGTEPLVCFCTAHDQDVVTCRWDGWEICANPPCTALVPPFKMCRKRPCAQWRKANNVPPVVGPPRTKPTRNRAPKRTVKKRKWSPVPDRTVMTLPLQNRTTNDQYIEFPSRERSPKELPPPSLH